MVGVRLEPELEQRLEAVVAITGRTRSYYVREAIKAMIEDWEDTAAAIASLKTPGRRWSLEELIHGDDLRANDVEG